MLTGVMKNDVLTLMARNPLVRTTRFAWDRDPRPEITYTLEVPENVQLELETSDGSITVGNLRGRM